MPSSRRVKRKNKKHRPSTVDLSLLWKAAFCQNAQLRRGEWLRVDLAAGMRTIQKELQSKGAGVSLSYLSTAYLGLCRIMTSQVQHFCGNVTVPRLDFEELNKQLGGKRGPRKGKDSAHSQLDANGRADPLLREFHDTCAKIEAYKVQQQQMTETGAQKLASLLSAAELSSLNQAVETNSVDVVNEAEATAYFDGLYGQMNSANFEDECADLMDEHFRGGIKKKKNTDVQNESESGRSKRFAEMHQQEIFSLITAEKVHTDGDDNISQPPAELLMLVAEEHEEAAKVNELLSPAMDELPATKTSEVPLAAAPTAPLPAKRRRPKRVRRKRTKAKRARAKRLSGLKLHLEEYCKSKSGYHFAVEENADSKLTEPNRSMSEHLTPHFSPATSGNSGCSEQPQQESQDQIALQEIVSEQHLPLVVADDCTEVQISTSTVSPSDCVGLRDSLSPATVPSVNSDFAEENSFCDNFVDISEVPKQPQVPAVKPLMRQPIPVVRDYRQMQVKTGEKVVSVSTSTEKIDDSQILSLLNSAMDEQATSELPFSDFVNCIGQPPSRQNVALTFCSLLSLSAQPNSGVKLNDEITAVKRDTRLPIKKLTSFSKLTLSLASKSALSGQSKLN